MVNILIILVIVALQTLLTFKIEKTYGLQKRPRSPKKRPQDR